jgi:hypothetical protein
MSRILVSVRDRPFQTVARGIWVDEGLTVAEIIDRAAVPHEYRASLIVMLNNQHEIEPRYWRRFRFLAMARSGGQIFVNIDVLPEGGNNRQLIGIIGAIAISLGTIWIGGGGLALLLGTSGGLFGAGTASAAAAAAAFGFVGSLALGALAPPPLPAPGKRQPGPRQLAGYGANAPALLEQLPTVCGRMRVSPPLVVPPYTTLVKTGDTKAHVVVGLVGRHLIQFIEINGTKIEDLEGVEYRTREGWDDDAPLELVTNTVLQENPQIKLDEFDLKAGQPNELETQGAPNNSVPQWQTYRTRGPADQAIFRLFWPQGMTETEGENFDEAAMPVRLRLRLRGSGTWIYLPELHFRNQGSAVREKRQQIRIFWNDVDPGAFSGHGAAYAAYWLAGAGQDFEYEANGYFDPGAGIEPARVATDKLGYTIHLDPAVFPKGTYEISIKRGLAYQQDNFNAAAYSFGGSATDANFFDYYDDGGVFKVRHPASKYSSTCLLEVFQTVVLEYPLTQKNLTLIEVTGINLQINSVSAIFTSYAPVLVAGAWTTDDEDQEPTTNPGALLRDTWMNPVLNADPKPSAIVDSDNLEAFYLDCVANGYECNLIVEPGQSVKSTAQIIAATGYAAVAEFEKWGVAMDRDTSGQTVAQIYTPLNTRNFRMERAFADLPHALKAEFYDANDDFKLKERLVYADGHGPANATLFEGMRYPGFTSESKVVRRALRDLTQMGLRDLRYPFETGIENLRTPQGGLCGLNHDVVAAPHAFSYVKAKVLSGGDVQSITLEAEIDFAAAMGDAAAVGASIRLRDGTVIVKQIDETAPSKIASFTAPFADTPDLERDCLVGFGPLGQETTRVRVFEIERLDDDRARLLCLDEAPDVYGFALDVDGEGARLDVRGDGNFLMVE